MRPTLIAAVASLLVHAGAALAQSDPALPSTGGAASAADPLKTAECRKAMAVLEAQNAASAPTGKGADETAREAAKQQASRACLGNKADPPPPKRIAQPPIAVPPVAALTQPLLPQRDPLALPQRPAVTALPRPLSVPTTPTVVTSCDGAGCWASDGTRLQRSGSSYVTPSGLCRVEAGLVRCP